MKGIDVLPDDDLLAIFDFFYVDINPLYEGKTTVEEWQTLVHVCRRWRSLVLGSPRRLNLQLYCTPKTPARNTLDVWPALPLIVAGNVASSSGTTDNIIAAFGQSNRIFKVLLDLAGWQVEQVLAAMQVPFPNLTRLRLSSPDDEIDETPPVVPDSFLDGSAPSLRSLELDSIPIPGLPKLLLSATRLVYLRLSDIPHSGYFSPEAMVALISALSSLDALEVEFRSPQSCPGRESRSLPPLKRSILPALDDFRFKGATEYLEDLVASVDAPQLNTLYITFFNQIDFDCPRLAQFVNCTPTFRTRDEAFIQFDDSTACLKLRYRTSKFYDLEINTSCKESDWQLSFIEQICNSPLHPLSTVEDLYIEHRYSQLVWKNDAIDDTLWFELLHPLTAVKNLYLSKEFAPGIAAALQELGITEVFPSLQDIFVEGLESSGSVFGQFATERIQSGQSIDISVWNRRM